MHGWHFDLVSNQVQRAPKAGEYKSLYDIFERDLAGETRVSLTPKAAFQLRTGLNIPIQADAQLPPLGNDVKKAPLPPRRTRISGASNGDNDADAPGEDSTSKGGSVSSDEVSCLRPGTK
jgi:hypothetical protein